MSKQPLPVVNQRVSPSQAFERALHFHQQGRLDQAELLYKAVLEAQPEHFDARHLFGVVRSQQGRHIEALDLISAALKIRPNSAAALSNLGLTLGKLGRLEDALATLDKALAIKPDYAEALNNRGAALKDLKRSEEALASYDKALAIKPDFVEALNNRGNALIDLRRPDEALSSYDKAIAIKPDYAEALIGRGAALKELKRPDEALSSYDKAIAIKPDYAEAFIGRGAVLKDLGRLEGALASFDKGLAIKPGYAEALNNRGVALKDLGRLEEALASYDKALAIKVEFVEALNNRGNALLGLKRRDEALASYDKALAIKPDYAEALYNRGNALIDLKRPTEALASYDKAIAINPDYAEAFNNRGAALKDLSRLEEALASYDKAIAIKLDYAEAFSNRGQTSLLRGDFPSGWRDYEHRFDLNDGPKRNLAGPYPIWNGEDVRGKRIVVYEEQGIGDVIQFVRYLVLPPLRRAAVTFLARPSLHRLLQPLAPTIRITDAHPPGEVFDFQCSLLSLPAAFGTTLNTIPSSVPYLLPEASLVVKWRQRLGNQGFKVGIAWQGNPESKADIGRSIPLRCFRAIAAIPGVRLFSLQKRHGVDQLFELDSVVSVEALGAELDSGPDAFIDTAAIMAWLDLIVTADTSIAHLAGALGVRVWVALKNVPDWRWMLDRLDSPWYPTMTLYRQTYRDDWDEVFDRIASDLATLK